MYSFLEDIQNLRKLHKSHHVYTGLTYLIGSLPLGTSAQATVVNQLQQEDDFHNRYMNKIIPIMLCVIWEVFVNELKDKDPEKHQEKFTDYAKWYNVPIKEISEVRHCIVHSGGTIGSYYLKNSPIKKYKRNDVVALTDPEIEVYFKTFEDAYNNII